MFASELSLHYIILNFISVSEWKQMISRFRSSAGTRTKQDTWLREIKWCMIQLQKSQLVGSSPVQGFAFLNLCSASLASVIVLKALRWPVQGRLEGQSPQNMTLSLFTSCSLLPSAEAVGEEMEMQFNADVGELTLKKQVRETLSPSAMETRRKICVYYKPVSTLYICCAPQQGLCSFLRQILAAL